MRLGGLIAIPIVLLLGWGILGTIEWVLYGKIVWKYEIKHKTEEGTK
jgi:hypothetical protein